MSADHLVPSIDSLRPSTIGAIAIDPGGKGVDFAVIRERVAEKEGLPRRALKARFPSGNGPIFDKRVGWAIDLMEEEGLVERLPCGSWRLTEEGKRSLPFGNQVARRIAWAENGP